MISPLSRSTTVLKTAIAGLLSLLPISLPALGAEKVIIASTGGAYDKALREAWFDPFTKATGIEVVTVAATNSEMRAKAAAMVKTGNVNWTSISMARSRPRPRRIGRSRRT